MHSKARVDIYIYMQYRERKREEKTLFHCQKKYKVIETQKEKETTM